MTMGRRPSIISYTFMSRGFVHVHVLRVGMQFHALEAQADGAFDFLLRLGIVLVRWP